MLKSKGPSVAAVAGLLILWQLVCTVGLVPSYMLPSPVQVLEAFFSELGALWKNSLITLQEAFIGLILGVSVGFLAAVLMDAIWIFYGWAGVACEVAGLPIDYFEFAVIDPVFDYYTPVIIGGNVWLEEHPETAKAFLSALSKGYTYAVEHPKEAADILMEAAPELKSNAELVYASQEYLAAEYVADAARWGEFDADRWAAFFRWLNENSLLESEIDPSYGFTNAYLP